MRKVNESEVSLTKLKVKNRSRNHSPDKAQEARWNNELTFHAEVEAA